MKNILEDARWRVDRCLNLEPDKDGRLVAAHTPRVVATTSLEDTQTPPAQHNDQMPAEVAADRPEPLAVMRQTDGRKLMILTPGRDVVAVDDQGQETLVGQLGGEPMCHLVRGNMLTVMTPIGAWQAEVDDTGTWTVISAGQYNLPIMVSAVRTLDYSATVTLPTLSRRVSDDSELSSSERRSLTGAVTDAYIAARERAMADGCLTDPVIGRVTVSDSRGHVLMVTPPVLLTCPATSDIDAPIGFDSADGMTMASRQLTLTTYRPMVTVGDDLPVDFAELRLQLWLTPAIESVNPDGFHILNFGRTPGTNYLRVTLTRPARAVSTLSPRTATHTVSELLATLDDNMYRCDMAWPCAVGSRTVYVTEYASRLERQSYVPGGVPAWLCPPHRMLAGVVAATSPAVVWGKVKSLPFAGYNPVCYAAELEDIGWRGQAMVVLDNGDTAVKWQGEGQTGAPIAFNPLVSYPMAGARSLTVIIETDDGRVLTHHVSLASAPGGRMSWSLDLSLANVLAVQADEPTLPEMPEAPAREFDNTLVIAGYDEPLMPVMTSGLDSPACVLTPSFQPSRLRAATSTRFDVFTSGGIYEAVVDMARRQVAMTLVDNAVITDGRLVTVGNNTVYALSGSRLLTINGTGVSIVADHIPQATAIGWDEARRAVLVAVAGGDMRRYMAGHGWLCVQVDGCEGDGWVAERGVVLATDRGRVLDLTDGQRAGSTHVVLEATLNPEARPRTVAAVTMVLDASVVDGTLSIGRDYIGCRRAPLTRLAIHGAVHCPIHVPMTWPHAVTPAVVLDTEMTPDGCVAGFIVTHHNHSNA